MNGMNASEKEVKQEEVIRPSWFCLVVGFFSRPCHDDETMQAQTNNDPQLL